MPTKKEIVCIGTNHRKAPIELRENLFIDQQQIASHLKQLSAEFNFSELLILSTCNRLEITGSISELNLKHLDLMSVFMRLQELCGHHHVNDTELLRRSLYSLVGTDALVHVIRVAASLDSMVLGETQITGQFKAALDIARDQGLLGGVLERLGQEALATAKKVRSQTEIGKRPVSIASAAVELVHTVFNELKHHSVMIVGAGEMARVVAEHLVKAKVKHLAIVNRSENRAQLLIEKLGMGRFIALDSLSDELEKFDVVITATTSNRALIHKKDFETLKSSSKMRLCVDISLPRNIDPACSELDDLFTFDIDDLKQIISSNSKLRNEAALDGGSIVKTSAQRFSKWLELQELNPILKENHAFFSCLVEREFARSKADWGANTAMVNTLKASLIKKLTATVNRNIQVYDQNASYQIDLDLLNQIFKIEEKVDDEA